VERDIVWYAQSAFRIDVGGLRVYLDPYRLPPEQPPADIMLLSHDHSDHLCPEDIAAVRTAKTVVFAAPPAARKLDPPVVTLAPGQSAQHGQFSVRAMAAYNVDKFRRHGVPFHPRESQHVGFVFEVAGFRFYFAGDTDPIPEMDEIGSVDYAFLPVSGTYVMTAEEAADVVRRIDARVVVPMHYGTLVGSVDDAKRLAKLTPPGVEVRLLEPAGR
jgi:L-ascorbate metabolism protein UlaG (beta-lactamase superfamily)